MVTLRSMEKLDFKQHFKAFYSPKTSPEIVDVPPMQYLMIDGTGDPNTSEQFELAVGALYSIAYTVKFGRKKAGVGPDFTMGPLEGLWWMGDNTSFDQAKKEAWLWTIMLWLPDAITSGDIEQALAILRTKKPNSQYEAVRLEVLREGAAVQIMHIGPYSAEEPTIRTLHNFVEEQGAVLRGKHHEIYFGDPRRSKPEKLKTIIRHPISH